MCERQRLMWCDILDLPDRIAGFKRTCHGRIGCCYDIKEPLRRAFPSHPFKPDRGAVDKINQPIVWTDRLYYKQFANRSLISTLGRVFAHDGSRECTSTIHRRGQSLCANASLLIGQLQFAETSTLVLPRAIDRQLFHP